MSRPQGPVPYSAEEIDRMTTPEEKFKARASLRSFIAGHKLANLRDQGVLGPPNYALVNNNNGTILRFRRDSTSPEHDALNASALQQSSPSSNAFGPQRVRSQHNRAQRFEPYPRDNRGNRLMSGKNCNVVEMTPIVDSELPCPTFTKTGTCTRFKCPDVHDIKFLAVCKRFLFKESCIRGSLCPLSHEAGPKNTPHCVYHIQGRCENASCKFIHGHTGLNAPVCVPFAKLGCCAAGEACHDLHAFECPDFANKGACNEGILCALPHVHKASRMKAAAAAAAATPGSSEVTTPESFAAVDGIEYIGADMSSPDNDTSAITQQHDYVAFDSED